MERAKVSSKNVKLYTAIGFMGFVYSSRALASTGTREMFQSSLRKFVDRIIRTFSGQETILVQGKAL